MKNLYYKYKLGATDTLRVLHQYNSVFRHIKILNNQITSPNNSSSRSNLIHFTNNRNSLNFINIDIIDNQG